MINDSNELTQRYLALIQSQEFAGLNLTSLSSFEEIHYKQTLDALIPFEKYQQLNNLLLTHQILVDIGFGGGFPLLPLAWRYMNLKIMGIDARRKKVDAVRSIAKKMSLMNIALDHGRMEQYLIDCPAAITAKGVSSIDNIFAMLHVTEEFRGEIDVLLFKGPNFYEKEGKLLKKVEKNWDRVGEYRYHLPNESERLLLHFKPNVPRGTTYHQTKVKQNKKSIKDIVYG